MTNPERQSDKQHTKEYKVKLISVDTFHCLFTAVDGQLYHLFAIIIKLNAKLIQ